MTDTKEFINLANFEKQERIGFGGFGEVFKVLEKSTGKTYAAKISMIDISEDQKSLVIELRHEINILAQLNHPSILKFIGYSPTNFLGEPKPVIVTEFSTNGSLKEMIDLERNSKQPKLWDATKKLINIYGIASAMAYLHSHNIIHRDLKTGNILEDDYLFPKLADFGLSKIYHQSETSMSAQSTKDLKGTPKYVAPESWEKYEYTKEGDVYSFSFIVYQILTLEEPFKNYNMQMIYSQVVKKGYRPEFNKPIADCYKELITQCWSAKPSDRPTFSEIVEKLKTDPKFITDEIDKDKYISYIDLIEHYQTTYDPSKRFQKITVATSTGKKDEDEDEQEKFKNALRRFNKKKPVVESTSSSSSTTSTSEKVDDSIFNEISKLKEFGSLPEETQEFLKHTLSDSQSSSSKSLTIPTNKTVLLFANESLNSPDFLSILKHFESITVEIKYPSNVFEQILNTLSNLNIATIKVHITVSETTDIKKFIQNFTKPIVITFESPNITQIAECSFERCVSLVEVTIPDTIQSIGNSAFSGCSKLSQVTIPTSVLSIGNYAFSGCSKLAEINVPSSVSVIGDGCFCFCSKLTKITVPSSVKKISQSAFKGDSCIAEVTLEESSNLEVVGSDAFKDCSCLKEFKFTKSVKEISAGAFQGCSSLVHVSIPSSVVKIGCSAFEGCVKLEKISFEDGSELASIGEKAFSDCVALDEFYVPMSVKEIECKAFEGCKALKKITIPASFKKLFLSKHLGIDKNVEIIKI